MSNNPSTENNDDPWADPTIAPMLQSRDSEQSEDNAEGDDPFAQLESEAADPGDSGLPDDDDPESEGDEGEGYDDDGSGYDPDEEGVEGAHSERKPASKLKTYALIGGIAVAMVGMVGGGLYVKMSKKSAPGPVQVAALPPEPVAQEPVKPQPVTPAKPVQSPQPVQPATQPPAPQPPAAVTPPPPAPVQAEPVQAVEQEAPAPAQASQPEVLETAEVRVDVAEPQVDAEAIEDLRKKTDMLAEVVLRAQDRLGSVADDVSDKHASVESDLQSHDKRLDALEAAIDELREAIQKLEPKKVAAKKAVAKPRAKPVPKEPAKAQTPTDSKVKTPTSSIRVREVPAQRASAGGAAKGVTGYAVVATYPSSEPGVTPQRAWVTNGEKLVEVAVGSSIEGARVTKIDGTTVYTSMGAIHAAR